MKPMKSIGIALTFAALGMFVGVTAMRTPYPGDPGEVMLKTECLTLCSGITSGDHHTIQRVEQELRECEARR